MSSPSQPMTDVNFHSAHVRPEERAGLIFAIAIHACILALLLLRPSSKPLPPPVRMEVSLVDNVGLQATSPNPNVPAAAAIAPTLGEAPPPPAPVPTQPQPKAVPKPEKAKLLPMARIKPKTMPVHHQERTTKAAPIDAIAALVAEHDKSVDDKPRTTHKKIGASRIGADFLKGLTSANSNGKAQAAPGSVAGPAAQAGIRDAISRDLHAHWEVPQGVDTDKLVTVVRWDLNPDGTLSGSPHVVSQSGVDPSNRPQAARHAEMAIRAIRLAAPFQLPPRYYSVWRHLQWTFDRNLAQ